MKRFICVFLSAVLCLAVGTASAACVIEKVADIEGADFMYDGSLLRVREDSGYRVASVDGSYVTDEVYADVNNENGFVSASKGGEMNSYGLFDESGNVLMPYKYGDIEVLSADWALGFVLKEATADNYDYSDFDDNYFLIDTVDVYNLKTAQCMQTLPRANYKDADAVNHCINIENRADGVVTTYDQGFNALGTVDYTFDDEHAPADVATFRKNRHEGLMDKDGNVILPPTYYMIFDFENGVAKVEGDDEKEGLINEKGEVLVEPIYDEVDRSYYLPYTVEEGTFGYNAGGYYAVILDGKLGYVNEQGVVTCEPKLSEKLLENNGASATYTDMEGSMHILAADGVDTVLPEYNSIYCADYSAGRLYKVTDEDYNYGLIDWHGEEVVPCTAHGFSFSSDGRYMIVETDWDEGELYTIEYEGQSAAAPAAPAPMQDVVGAADEAAPANSLMAAVSAKRGEAAPAAEKTSWTCTCGTVNEGKFCTECGQKKPEAAVEYRCGNCGWEPEDPAKLPKFCPECGDPFDETDVK